ncbi:uncharacterized protein LOC132556082 [Ylistrum balloti]|uniref:uncharacterized protein LOC132556082 n=1 Tax=Ylistrum balloti TaxID=509963 RepID=UPI002905CE5E|nr:uncharacterized protein LOC132556082 [Ylistrum balloti]
MAHRVSSFLLNYWSTPHSVTGVSPADLFLKRQLRNKFSLLQPNFKGRVSRKQMMQKEHHDKGRVKVRSFVVNQTVRVRNFRGGLEKWVPGKIVKQLGPLTYLVRVGPIIRYAHVDHIVSSGEEIINDGPIKMETESVVDTSLPTSQPITPRAILTSVPEIQDTAEIGGGSEV